MAAHSKHALAASMFERWLQIWGETADEVFTPDVAVELKDRSAAIAESLQAGLALQPRRARPAAQ